LSAAVLVLLFFAQIKEVIGHESEPFTLIDAELTPRDIVKQLIARGGNYAAAFADTSRLKCALDQEYAKLDTPIGNARELAFFPPVTGG
jgi:sulfur-carrier protein